MKNKFGFNYSYSSVSTFKQCPMRFKLVYLDKEPIVQTDALIKGNEVHDMCEELVNDFSKNKEITLDLSKYKHTNELRNFLELETLRSNKYDNKELYFDNVCEEKILDEDIMTVGKLDRVYKLWNGKKVLLDYKTGKVRPKDYYYAQLALYTKMYNNKYPESPIDYWEIDWLTESKQYFIEPVKKDILDKEYNSHLENIKAIEKTEYFKPKMSPLCLWCPVLHVCPYKNQVLDKFNSLAKRKGLDMDAIIRKAIRNRTKKLGFSVHSKVVGTTFTDMAKFDIKEDDELILRREPDNEFDENAIAVYWGIEKIGYIKRTLAKDIAKSIDKGNTYKCFVSNITGGTTTKENKGINIKIVRI